MKYVQDCKPKFPNPMDVVVSELPGPALTSHKFDGFGKSLTVPMSEDTSEPFGEDEPDE